MNKIKPAESSPSLQETKIKSMPLSRSKTFSGFNPYQIPPDLNLAKTHGKAKRIYLSKVDGGAEEGGEVCVCCGLPVKGELIPLTAHVDRLYHLGSGYALYFSFIKYCIALLGLIFVISGMYNLISNVSEGDCEDYSPGDNYGYCIKGYILSFTIANKRDNSDLLSTQLALNLVTVVLIMLFFHFFRWHSRKIVVAADDKTITPSDYTIRIDGIPPETKNSEIEQWLEGFSTEEMPIKVERIIRPYNINGYIALMKESSNLVKDKQKLMELNGTSHSKKLESIRRIDTRVANITKDLEKCKQQGLERCSNVFVTFNRAHESVYIQDKFRKPFLSNFLNYFISSSVQSETFQGHKIKIKRAPEPTDILWENLGFSSAERRKYKLFTVLVTAVVIIICFAIIVLINWGQELASDEFGEESFVVQVFSIFGSVFIFLTNYILSWTLDILSKYEKHLTFTYYLKGIAEKLSISQFINTAIATFVAELILAADAKNNQSGLQAINFYGKGGLFESIYWVFITSAFLTPLLTIFDPTYILQLVRQYWAERQGDNLHMYQKKANSLFEGPPIALTSKYAQMIKIVLLTALYAPGVPFSMIYTIIGLVLCYWTEKYSLLRRNCLPKAIDDELADTMLEYLEFAAFTFSVGNIIYAYTLKNSVDDFAFDGGSRAMVWISLGISLFHIIFPMELLNKKLFPIKDEITESATYQEARLEFNTDYDIENPITRKKALQAFIKRLQKKPNLEKPEFLKKLEKGILGRMELEEMKKVLDDSEGNNDNIEEDKIDFDFLDIFANNVQLKQEEGTAEFNEVVNVANSLKNLDHHHNHHRGDETRGGLLTKVVMNHIEKMKDGEQEEKVETKQGPEQQQEQQQGQEREPDLDPEINQSYPEKESLIQNTNR